jgi:hypothetical protein
MVDDAEKRAAYAHKKALSQEIGEEATCRTRRQHRSLTKGAEKEVRHGQKNPNAGTRWGS